MPTIPVWGRPNRLTCVGRVVRNRDRGSRKRTPSTAPGTQTLPMLVTGSLAILAELGGPVVDGVLLVPEDGLVAAVGADARGHQTATLRATAQ